MISGVWWMTGFRVRMYITISSPQSARAFTFIRRGWLSIYSFWTWHRSFILPISYRWAFVRLFGWYAASWNHFLLQSKVKCWRDSIVIFLRQKLFLANYKTLLYQKTFFRQTAYFVSAWSLWQSLTVERGQWLGLEVWFLCRLTGCISFLLFLGKKRGKTTMLDTSLRHYSSEQSSFKHWIILRPGVTNVFNVQWVHNEQ